MYWSTLGQFYKSKEWQEFRLIVISKRLVNGQTICEHCGKPIVRVYDTIAHHKKELTLDNVNDVSVSLNESNIMLVHASCHNELHSRWGRYTRHVYLVCGGSREERIAFVERNGLAGDLVCEAPRIFEAISIGDSDRCMANAMAVRDLLMDMVKHRRGKWTNAFVVGPYEYSGERERLANELEAEIVDVGIAYPPSIESKKSIGGL